MFIDKEIIGWRKNTEHGKNNTDIGNYNTVYIITIRISI
jgi:hypothetical protein